EQEIALKLAEIAGLHVDALHGLEQEARHALEQRSEEENALGRELETVESRISSLLEQIDARQAELRDAKKQVAQALARHAGFQETLARQQEEEKRQRAAAASMRELREECRSKLAGYRQDPRYAYLVAAQYGADAYRGSGLTRYFDSWIARQCN